MDERYCPTCGTEVDEDARFCPTCGTTLTDGAQPDLPPAPAWPEPEPPEPEPPEPEPQEQSPEAVEPRSPDEPAELPQGDTGTWAAEPPTAAEPVSDTSGPVEPPPPAHAPAPAATPPTAGAPEERRDDLPFSWPTTLSGWLIGGGAVVGALALIASLANAVSLLLFLALLGIAATVFLADRLPVVPRLRLITLGVAFVGLGVALERAGFSARGADSIFLVAMIAAAGGVLLLELDRDRPLPPPSGG